MYRLRCLPLLLLIAAALFLSGTAVAQSVIQNGNHYVYHDGSWYLQEGQQEFKIILDEMTLKFSPDVSETAKGQILENLGLEEIRHNRLGFYDVKVPEGVRSFDAAHQALKTGFFEHAFPATLGEYIADPDDPNFNKQWHFKNTGGGGGTPDADIDATEAWEISNGDPSIIVAPLDSGIDYHHNDLGPNLWQNLGEDADNDGQTLIFTGGQWVFDPGDINNYDDDGNGKKDDLVGWDAEHNNNDVMDIMGHGTHVSGIVAARTNNGTAVAGTAGGWGTDPGVSIMMVQVGDWAPVPNILDDAIIYATDNGARVITMSLTVPQDPAIDAALDYAYAKGVFIDCAAGNTGSYVTYPATHVTVAAISSTDKNDALSYFSAKGKEIELGAPGEDVYSTMPGQSHGAMSGTSMAAPHVAGAAGLVLSVAPWLDNVGVLEVLRMSADDKGSPGWDPNYGWGRLNLFNAVFLATGMNMLYPDTFNIDADLGGTVNFTLDAGSANGGRGYLLMASLSGTSPGIPIGSTTIPLNWDMLLSLSIHLANTFYFTNTMGVLNNVGMGSASFNANAGDLRPIAGATIHFAYLLDAPFDTASNAVPIFVVTQ